MVVLICTSLIISDEHFSCHLFIFLGKMSVKVFGTFFHWFLGVFLFVCLFVFAVELYRLFLYFID